MKKLALLIITISFSIIVYSQETDFKLKKDSLLLFTLKKESVINAQQQSQKNDENKKDEEPVPNALRNVFDRLYVSNIGIEAYRQNIDELLGRIVFSDNGKLNMGLLNIRLDTANIKAFVPENGRLLSHKLTEKSSKSIKLFINVSVTENRIYEYFVSDISRAILETKQIDKEKLKKLVNGIAEEDELKKYYLVAGVTVTEIFKRDFAKKTRKIKADNIPISATAISFENRFYISDENMEREYRIGLTTTRLDIVKNEVAALLND